MNVVDAAHRVGAIGCEYHAPARPDGASHLVERLLPVWDVVQHADADDAVEAGVRERQRGGIGLEERARRRIVGLAKQPDRAIQPDVVDATLSQGTREAPGPA